MFKELIYDGKTYTDYLIDELGNVKSLKRNRLMTRSVNDRGYYVVYLSMGQRGKVKGIRVHKAVAETFLPNPNNYPVVHHKDENKLNPSLDNLEWVTFSKNTQEHWKKERETNPYANNRKLSDIEVRYIRMQKGIMGYIKLSKKFGVSRPRIKAILDGKAYKEVL